MTDEEKRVLEFCATPQSRAWVIAHQYKPEFAMEPMEKLMDEVRRQAQVDILQTVRDLQHTTTEGMTFTAASYWLRCWLDARIVELRKEPTCKSTGVQSKDPAPQPPTSL
jgi:hypothetical protein